MDYNTLKNLVYSMPESYEEASQNESLNSFLKTQVIMERLVEKGIFEDWREVFILCSEAYKKYRQEAIDMLNEIEKEEF